MTKTSMYGNTLECTGYDHCMLARARFADQLNRLDSFRFHTPSFQGHDKKGMQKENCVISFYYDKHTLK